MLETCPHGNRRWIPLFCHSWKCDRCGPLKLLLVKGRLSYAYKVAASLKLPLRLVTLTYRQDVDKRFVLRSMQHLAQAMRRRFGTFEYARFPEHTALGRIHLHLVVLCPYIPQKILSRAWRIASQGSYIVDIRKVDSIRHLSIYVTKYVAKRPAAKVTFSRHFPDQYPGSIPSGPFGVANGFTYKWYDVITAAIDSAGSRCLWTGEPEHINGL